MGKLSRDKGARAEREIVALHVELGVSAEKVPLSGATKYQGGVDVDIYPWGRDGPPLVCEVKARGDGSGFKQLEAWLGDADLLFLRRDRQKPLVVLPWSTWQRLLKEGRA